MAILNPKQQILQNIQANRARGIKISPTAQNLENKYNAQMGQTNNFTGDTGRIISNQDKEVNVQIPKLKPPANNSEEFDPVKEAQSAKDRAITQQTTKYDEQSKMLEEQKTQDLARLKSILDSRKATIDTSIAGARDKFQPQRENVDVRRAQDLQRARELLAAQGIMGGDNLTTQMNINTQASDNISGIDQTQSDYVKNLENEAKQLDYAYDADTASAISKAYEQQRALLGQKSEGIANAENTYATNLMNAYKSKQEREDALKKQEQDRNDNLNIQQGLVEDPLTGKLVKTSSQNQLELNNKNNAETKKINDYLTTIGQYGNDYQAQINTIQNDNDPTNDWQTGYLKTAQTEKRAKMLQDSINTISQYGNDYQAEINKRTSSSDTYDDQLIPYLKQAQQQKKAAQQASQDKALEEKYKNYLEVFKQTGQVQTNEMSQYLGVPVGTYSMDYAKTVYDTNKPYFDPASMVSANASMINANNNVSKTNWDMNPDNPDNIAKMNQGSTSEKQIFDAASSYSKTGLDEDKATAKSIILNSNLNDDVKVRLLNQLNIPK